MTVRLLLGDCAVLLRELPADSIDSCVTDPPYGLEFMGKEWDAPWQVSTSSALFGKRKTAMPGWGTTRNPTCASCGGRLRGANKCACETPVWDEAVLATRLRQMQQFQKWNTTWAVEVLRVLKPGGHLLAFGGTRTIHRMICAIEDAGFEIRDCVAWLYGSGFPKSLDVSKEIDRRAGAERAVVGPPRHSRGKSRQAYSETRRTSYDYAPLPVTSPATDAAKQWAGWGTALKPAMELIVLARKPLVGGTVAANVLQHGTGALNIDGCRVGYAPDDRLLKGGSYEGNRAGAAGSSMFGTGGREVGYADKLPPGRWPANVVLDEEAGRLLDEQSGPCGGGDKRGRGRAADVGFYAPGENRERDSLHAGPVYADAGGASRFFYCAKSSRSERTARGTVENDHPTVKPLALMEYLCKLVTPPGGVVLDPFMGSGTTGLAAAKLGLDFIGIERDEHYMEIAKGRLGVVEPAVAAVAEEEPPDYSRVCWGEDAEEEAAE